MKISRLDINEFRHLKDLTFDFTYPEDYKDKTKAGKPLDKICFIGQSATGKTSLLELITESYKILNETVVNSTHFSYDYSLWLKNETKASFIDNNNYYEISKNKLKFNLSPFSYSRAGSFNRLISNKEKKMLYYIKANLISDKNIEVFQTNPLDLFEKFSETINKVYTDNLKNITPIPFDDDVTPHLWLFLLNEILSYRKKFNQKMSELVHKGLLANTKKLNVEFNNWQKENPNCLEAFAKKFNPILEKLNLEVDIVDTEYTIPLRNKRTGEIIPIQNASTGTKGLLLSFLPLYQLDTKESMVLIDEPERSLYPDMQMDLIEYYHGLAESAQIIVATHSPFIAASFEPEERFILYFDEEGKVQVRRGESPIGDDPNDMLKNDFQVNYYNKYGEEAYKKYINLKQDVATEKDIKKKKDLMLDMVKLGDKYNF